MEILTSGPASSKDFSNNNKNIMASSSENHSVKDNLNDQGQIDKAETEEIIGSKAKEDKAEAEVIIVSTTKEDTVPTLIVVTG
eukprot:5901903-Ditylum_brightwellii.AAC.1